MTHETIGFIGGGRIVRIILGGLHRAGRLPRQVVVADTDIEMLNKLKENFPQICVTSDNKLPASQDIVFVALHPPAIGGVAAEIHHCLKPNALVISLAPKLTIAKLAERLGGFQKIARVIPNAPSIINQGYNPIAVSPSLTEDEKEELVALFSILGDCPQIAEEKLEAYAVLTAMGPTYLWFQLFHLAKIGQLFGLAQREVEDGVLKMVVGAVNTMYQSGLSAEEVMDLIPAKPLYDDEDSIREAYSTRLEALFAKLKV